MPPQRLKRPIDPSPFRPAGMTGLGLTFDDFPPELDQTDATLAHAIERMYAICCEIAGFDWAKDDVVICAVTGAAFWK